MRELTPTKRALFEKLLEKAGLEVSDTSGIPRRKEEGAVSLSFAQQRLWLDNQLMPDSPFYNMPGNVHVEGKLDVAALAQSINALIRRHEVLRTSFPAHEGRPVQSIARALEIELPVHDLSEVPCPEREAKASQLALEEARQPFDMERDPLLRVGLLRMAQEEHILLLTIHHIITDGWSTEILIREMITLYEAFAAGRLPSLPELPIQYADFSVWQRHWLRGEILETQLSYWKRQLRAPLPVLQLPGRRPQSEIETFHAQKYELVIAAPLTGVLKALGQSEGVTLFMVLLAGFKTLLYRYTGQSDMLVGTWIANRMRPELEGLIGFFANTLVLRTQVSGVESFRDLLRQVKQVCLDAYAHQDLPFESLVDELRPRRKTLHNPLFQAAFAFQNAPLPSLEFSGLKLRPYEVATDYVIFDLLLRIIDRGSELSAHLYYNTSLFEDEFLKFMLHHLRKVLEEVAAQPEKRLLDISLLDEEERAFSTRQPVDLNLYEGEQFGFNG